MQVPRSLRGVPSQAEAEIVYRYTYVMHGLDHVNGLRAISKRQYIGIEQYTFSYHFINGQYFLLKRKEAKTTSHHRQQQQHQKLFANTVILLFSFKIPFLLSCQISDVLRYQNTPTSSLKNGNLHCRKGSSCNSDHCISIWNIQIKCISVFLLKYLNKQFFFILLYGLQQ